MKKKINIRDFSFNEIQRYFKHIDEKPFRAKQVYEWLWKKSAQSFDEMTNLSKELRQNLSEHFKIKPVKIKTTRQSSDGTIKTAFELNDKLLVEGVLIPSGQRNTACISSQVGCGLACRFCATGTLKFKRNLDVGEIYDQVTLIKKQTEEIYNSTLTNIVLMGMGEPMLNYDNVMAAVDIITSENGLGLSPSRITLSTVGVVKGIKRFADEQRKINLAVSLHSANINKRSHIVPFNNSNSLPDIAEAIKYYHEKTGNRITFEYLLLKNFNDSLDDAKELAVYCRQFPCKINLIEYNATTKDNFEKSENSTARAFLDFLQSKNMVATIRHSKGQDIDAACGQLANKTMNE